MRVWIPGDFGLAGDEAAIHARVAPIFAPVGSGVTLPRYSSRVALRLRFVHLLEVPPAGLAVRPPVPDSPPLALLAYLWTHRLEGILYGDVSQVSSIAAQREWGNVHGLEVIA